MQEGAAGGHFPLEPPRDVLERWLVLAGAFALDHVEALRDAPAVGAMGAEALRVAAEVGRGVPEEPIDGGMEEALRRVGRAAEAGLVPPGPGYLAYVPGSGLVATALADLVADCLNRFTGLAAAAPALCRLEADVLEWLAREFGLPAEARGLLTSGGSLANLAAVVTARVDRLGEEGDFREATVYTSSQAHHSVAKSVRLAGIPPRNLRLVPTDAAWRMEPDALAAAVAQDRAAGRRPFLVVASAGTTNTGAVDPLPRIADLAAEEGLWLHVDGAYGGAFVLCDEGRRALAGIGRADSITLDPHKGLFLPFGTGCLLVRDGEPLRRAHRSGAHYLQDFEAHDRGGEPPSPTDHGPELSRSFRGLRLWLPLVLHGARAFREALAEKLVLARRFHEGLVRAAAAGADVECVAPPQLSTVAFRRRRRAGEPLDRWNARNAAWLAEVNARRRVHLSSTSLPVEDGDAFTLRVSILNFRTHAPHVDAALEDLVGQSS